MLLRSGLKLFLSLSFLFLRPSEFPVEIAPNFLDKLLSDNKAMPFYPPLTLKNSSFPILCAFKKKLNNYYTQKEMRCRKWTIRFRQ